MNKAEICGCSGNTLEQVVDPKTTLRIVRKPDSQSCCLKVETSAAGILVVEIDGQKVATHALAAGTNMIPLTKLVPTRPGLFSRVNPLSLLNVIKPRRQSEPQAFTVFIRRGTENGALIGTYSFKIMSETAFDKAFDRYVGEKQEQTKYTTDERSSETTHNCWNCQKPIKANCCDVCGCEQTDDAEAEDQATPAKKKK